MKRQNDMNNKITNTDSLANAKLDKLNEVFLSLGNDFDKNIRLITATCGQSLDAQIVSYNRIYDDRVLPVACWISPECDGPIKPLKGDICLDIIKNCKKIQLYTIENLHETHYYKSDPNLSAYGIKTYMGYPVTSYDETIGILCALYVDNVKPEDKHQLILCMFAKIIGIEEENRQIIEISHIHHELGISLMSLTDLDQALPIFVDSAMKIAKTDCGSIYLVDSMGNFKLEFAIGLPDELVENENYIPSCSPLAHLIMKGEPIYYHEGDSRIKINEIYSRELIRSGAIIPVKSEDKVVACLNIALHNLERIPTYVMSALETIATQIGSFILKLKAEKEIQQNHEHLDKLVKERTAELIVLNEQLRESEEKYRNLVERATDGIIILQDYIVKYLNTRMAEMGGYTYDEVINTPFINYIHPNCRDTLINNYKNRMEGKDAPAVYEAVLMGKNGQEVFVEINAGRILYYGNPADLVIIRDITARKQEERALAIEKEKLQVTLNSIGDGVITTDVEGKIILINRVAESLTGWSKDEALGKYLTDVFCIKNLNDQSPVENVIEIVIKNNETFDLIDKAILVCKDGSTKIISNSIAPIYDSDGKAIGLVLVFRDITEKIKIEKELEKAQRIESIGVLAGGIAHDFNNILTAIIGNISLAKMYVNPNDKIFERLADAEKASERAKKLAQKLLTFSSGGAPIMKTTAMEQILRDSVDFALSGSNVRCEYNIADDLWLVDVDESQISQAINNVVVNACQAMPNGGIIKLSAENIHVESKNSVLLRTGKYIKISIEDPGYGISEDILPKIFDPYFTTKKGASGLGLAITYSIIRRHGGNIEVSSSLGKGTVFSIYLPVSPVQTVKEKYPSMSDIRINGKVLVMDDEKMIRDITSKILEINGYEVVTANDGLQAINLYKEAMQSEKPFDIVILDLTVPGGMGGKETIERLMEIDPNVKAIVSSGYSNDPTIENFRQIGFKDFIYKPYSSRELVNVIDNLIMEDINSNNHENEK